MECAKCRKVIKKNVVSCERCGRAWHPSCAGFKHGGRARSQWPSGQCNDCSFAPPQPQQPPQPPPQHEQHARRSPPSVPAAAGPVQPPHLYQQPHAGQLAYYDDHTLQYQDDDEDDGWQRYSALELELMEKYTRLECENRRRKDESSRLADEVHRLKDTTRNYGLAVRKIRNRQEVQSQEQHAKVVEIRNVFQREGEDVTLLALRVFSLLLGQEAEFSVKAAELDTALRLPYGALGPKPITVAFRDKARCEEVLRQRRPLRWADLARATGETLGEREDPDELVFVNAYLTPHFRRLLGLCKRVCKRVGIQYCWYRNCKVWLRYPADAGRPLMVEAPEDLLRLLPDSMRHVVENEITNDKAFRDKQQAADRGGFGGKGFAGGGRPGAGNQGNRARGAWQGAALRRNNEQRN